MTSDQIKAALDHGFSDAEAIMTAVGKADIAAEIELAKSYVENPLILQILATTVSLGLAKIGLADPKPVAPEASH